MPSSPRIVGIVAGLGLAALTLLYDVTLALGFAALRSPADQVPDPYFTALELLILAIGPAFVTLTAAVHVWTPLAAKVFTLTALAFAAISAGLTSTVHFMILIVSRERAFAQAPWLPLLISFRRPSIACVLDILAWDVFSALSVLFAQQAFVSGRLERSIRVLLITSAVLSLAGLTGLIKGDMQLRNIGILGYAVVFPVAAVSIARSFWLTSAHQPLLRQSRDSCRRSAGPPASALKSVRFPPLRRFGTPARRHTGGHAANGGFPERSWRRQAALSTLCAPAQHPLGGRRLGPIAKVPEPDCAESSDG
jgi:hypothetical protein